MESHNSINNVAERHDVFFRECIKNVVPNAILTRRFLIFSERLIKLISLRVVGVKSLFDGENSF